jgi:hypothetical protein
MSDRGLGGVVAGAASAVLSLGTRTADDDEGATEALQAEGSGTPATGEPIVVGHHGQSAAPDVDLARAGDDDHFGGANDASKP